MKLTSIQKFLYIIFIALFLCVSTFYGVSLNQTYREYKAFRIHEEKLKVDLVKSQQQLDAQKWYLNRFFNDPDFFEWVVRQRLGYARPQDVIFRFDEHS